MPTNRKSFARPPLEIRETDAEQISNLALQIEAHSPKVAEMLLSEINRAKLVIDARLSPSTVAMHSTVKFVDDESGVERTLQLVYPQEADIEAGRISITSLVGAGLIGLKAGQSISWPNRGGHERPLRIIEVAQC